MVLVVGHRGVGGIEPENTLRSFKKAIEMEVDYIECDVHLSSDGYPVVIHDDTVDRTTSGKGKVKDLTLKELRELDAGKGEKIPLLEEVLSLVKNKTGIIIEIKDPNAKNKVIETVENKKMKDEVLLASFDSHILHEIKNDFGKIFLSYKNVSLSLFIAKEVKTSFLGLKYTLIKPEVVRKVKENNLRLLAWTVNEYEDIKKLINLGVDAIASDFPGKIKEMLNRRV